MTSDAGDLVRRLQTTAGATFLELFFDVAFVFALRALAQLLFNKLTWSGAYQTLVVMFAIGWVWSLTVRVTDVLDPGRTPVLLLVLATMLGALVLSAAIPEAFGKTGLVFAGAYLAIQIGRNFWVVILLRHQEARHGVQHSLIWHAANAVPLLIGAFASSTVRTLLWTFALVVIYIGRSLDYAVPGLPHVRSGEWQGGWEHLAERYRALFVIGLGEVILGIGSNLTGHAFTTIQTVAFVVTFLITALVWRVYIFRAGQEMGPAIQASARSDLIATLASYAHVIMIGGLVVTSVGDALVLEHPLGHPRAAATLTILGGPAVFLVGRYLLSYIVFSHVDTSRLIGLLALALLVPPMLFLPPLVNAMALGAVLTSTVIVDGRRSPRIPVSPPGPHRASNQ
jgi:low temperature requirement protein LtrA